MDEKEMRELDAWIDREVFGMPVPEKPTSHYLHQPCDYYRHGIKDGCTYDSAPVPRYTTDRAASQEVLERCLENLPLTLEMGVVHFGTEKKFWIGRPDQDSSHALFAETLPLAICLLAKKLFGKE